MFINGHQIIPIALKNYQSNIEQPSEVDCLCGKDVTFGRHRGNRIFRERVLSALPQYKAARTKVEKMKITKSIVDYMKKQGSRFLKLKNNGSWVEIDNQAARDKVSHALRFAVRQQRKENGNYRPDTSSFCSEDEVSSTESSQVVPLTSLVLTEPAIDVEPAKVNHAFPNFIPMKDEYLALGFNQNNSNSSSQDYVSPKIEPLDGDFDSSVNLDIGQPELFFDHFLSNIAV